MVTKFNVNIDLEWINNIWWLNRIITYWIKWRNISSRRFIIRKCCFKNVWESSREEYLTKVSVQQQ